MIIQSLRNAFGALCMLCLVLFAQSLAAQTTDFRQVFDQHGVPMLLIDPATGQLVDANPAAAKFYGHGREVLTGMSIQQINTLNPEQVAAERALAEREGRNYFIFRHALADGEIRTVEVYSHPFIFEGRRLLLSLIHDITPGRNLEQGMWHYQQRLENLVAQRTAALETRSRWLLSALLLLSVITVALVFAIRRQKRAEAALAYRQGLFSALFEQSDFLAGILDRDGRLREVNQRALAHINQPAQAVIGQAFVDTPWWQETDKLRLRDALARAADGQADSFEVEHPGVDGQVVTVLFHALPVTIGETRYISVIGVDVSELKRLVALEARNQQLFAAVFDQAAVGLAMISPAGQFLKINPQFAAILGYGRDEMLLPGFDLQEITHPEDRARDQAQVHSLLAGEADSYRLEKRYFHKAGHLVWVSLDAHLVRDENQQALYFISAIRDITDRKVAEFDLCETRDMLERSEALLRRVIDAMPHIVIVKDANGRFQLVNAALANFYGSSPEAMVGKDDGDFNPDREQVEFFRRNLQEIIASGVPQVVQEDSTCAATGQVRHYQSVKVPFPGRDGAPGVLIVATDITDLYETQRRLRASEERLAYNLEATRDGLWDWSVLEDRVDHNEQWGRILGLNEVPSFHPVSFFAERIHPDDRETVMARITRAMETGSDYNSEHRVLWPDGHVVWVNDRGKVVVRDAEGHPLRMVGSIRDITESKEAEAALIEAKQAAEAGNLAKSRFLATMSHELRTPLNGVLGMAQLLLAGPTSEQETQEYARTILNSGQSLLTQLNDILDLSKVEAGKFKLDDEVLVPEIIVRESESLFGAQARAKGLELSACWSGPAGQRYRGDPQRLRQMLTNLVNNAIKFTGRGAVHIEARELEVDGLKALLEFSVSDTGIGIPANKKSMLFQPFTQVDDAASRQFGGSGLGLSIVKSLALLMAGEVGVDSQADEGSRFWFRVRLERLPERTDTPASPGYPGADGVPAPIQLTGRVLVVEDAPTNQIVIRSLLKTMAIEVLTAENGEQGVNCVLNEADHIDAILMDIQMPLLDGYAATARIRAWEQEQQRKPLPIIALTADAFADDEARCLAVGMDGYLAKPVQLDALAAMLAKWLPPAPQLMPLPSPEVRLKTLDWSVFKTQAEALLPLLAAARFDAIDGFAKLEMLASGTPLAAELASIRPDINALRFASVRAAITQMLSRCPDA